MRFVYNGLTMVERGPIDAIKESAIESFKESVKEHILAFFEVVLDVVQELSYSIVLVGGGVCMLLWLGGWRDGKRYTLLLFMIHVLIRFLLGGL